MRFNHHANTSLSGLREECRHGHLSPGMEVDLRLLDEHHLTRTGGQERHHYRERLRDPETDIRDVDEVTCSPLFWPGQPSDAQLDLSIVYSPRVDLPGQSQMGQSFA